MENLIDKYMLLTKEKQKKGLFWFYAINLIIALIIEVIWAFITPKFDLNKYEQGNAIILGFLLLSLLQLIFAVLAVRHIDSLDPVEDKEKIMT